MIIGVVGPIDSSKKIKEDLKKVNPDLEIKQYIREKVIDAIEVIEDCEKECDGIILTGCGVDEAIKSKYKIKKPYTFVSRGDSSILKAFWNIRNSNIDLDKFSIDVVNEDMVDEVIEEIGINPKKIYYLPFLKNIDEADYIKWHMDLFEKKEINLMITGFEAVYNELKRLGYPVFKLEPTKSLVKYCYKKIMTQHAFNNAECSKLAVEILNISDYDEDINNYYSNMIKKSDINKVIVEYVRSIDGALFPFGRNKFIVFINKGAINNEENYNKLHNLKKHIKSIGFTLNIGIGLGKTAYEAESNAHKALKESNNSKGRDIFLVDEKNNLTGPLGNENEISYSIINNDENTINISQKTSLSCEYVNKIMSINKSRQSSVYDSKELAGYLDISERSARRILQKIMDADLARVYGKESSRNGGRPKSLIEILF
ncbi:transcriptional regulator [Romboutsia sedimentorum]|jgi:hypothetical protein|uniref:Transcriptional regulator n=1 Tax=Romboutsia sedimentorum TaxID=1368474 RepID=A0ABT7E8S0_9FIRM|nr:transcriptional regulator [Romboutsia sedimentorum]MDK2562386.1 transcriptional regulator [Romboutsia sedimentorum]